MRLQFNESPLSHLRCATTARTVHCEARSLRNRARRVQHTPCTRIDARRPFAVQSEQRQAPQAHRERQSLEAGVDTGCCAIATRDVSRSR
jgi:hypothetical protein